MGLLEKYLKEIGGQYGNIIVCLQDVRKGRGETFSIAGISFVVNNTGGWKRGTPGGVAVGVSRGTSVRDRHEKAGEIQIVETTNGPNKYLVCNTYSRPNRVIDEEPLRTLEE